VFVIKYSVLLKKLYTKNIIISKIKD